MTVVGSDGTPPLFTAAPPAGLPSPSPSLRVERYDLAGTDWHSHRHVEQVVALYLKPARVRYAPEGSGGSRLLSLGPDAVTICQRERSESIRWTDPARFLCVGVSDRALREAAAFLRGRERFDIRPASMTPDPTLTRLLQALEAERARDFPSGRLFLDSVETALAAALIAAHEGGGGVAAPRTGGLAPFRLKRVLAFMQEKVDGGASLDELAEIAGLSVSHFAHQFRQSAHQSPYRYMQQLRIERAKGLLENPRLSVLEVALALGFETSQHFATVFRRVTGLSPSTYRRQL